MRRAVLHVVGGMNRGGVETWLMHIFRNIDRSRFRINIAVHTTASCAYDDELRALGIGVLPCLAPAQPWRYARNFLKLLRTTGPYDVVHSHVHHYSGFVLRLAKRMNVNIRIAHSHNDLRTKDQNVSVARQTYLSLTGQWIQRCATRGLAASRGAAESLFGAAWERDSRWRTLYYGLDLTPLKREVNGIALRRELGIPPDALVVGHVGRFHEQKNHKFLIEIAANLRAYAPSTVFLLIGEGDLQASIGRVVKEAQLEDTVKFLSARADVYQLMKGVMNAFVFPSLYEGLGIVLVEAQAAGLPCICSDVVPVEADVVPALVTRLPLTCSPDVWAKAVLSKLLEKQSIDQVSALNTVVASRFNLPRCVEELSSLYDGKLT